MPAVSKHQRRLFGMVDAAKHHKFHSKNHDLEHKVKEMAKDMSLESVQHFSKTKEKHLPEKKAFVYGFLKRAHEVKLPLKELPEYIKLAGLDKEAFLPLLIDLLGGVGGSIAGSALGESLATRTAMGGMKFLPNMIRNPLAKMAPVATKAYKPGQILKEKGMLQQVPSNVGMMAGGELGADASGMINNHIAPPDQNNLSLPSEQSPQYNN